MKVTAETRKRAQDMRQELTAAGDALIARAAELDKRASMHRDKARRAECDAAYRVHSDRAAALEDAREGLMGAALGIYRALVALERLGE